jgi:hypothetical protein
MGPAMMVEEIAAAAESARWNTYAAWAQMQASRAQVLSDIATHASPAIVAADRAEMDTDRQEFTRRRNTHLDVTA